MSYLLFFHRLADRDLWSSHEGRAAMDAQTILDDGGWGLPRLYGERPELQKPPMYYWLVAAIGWLEGGRVNAWAVRLPAAGSALLCVLGLYWFLQRLGRPVAGLIGAVVLATCLHFTWLARVGRIDMPLTLAVGASITFLHLSMQSARPRLLQLLAYLALAAGILLKGPVAFVLVAAVVGSHLLLERRLRDARRLGLWWGLPLALGVAGLWFVWANVRTHNELFRVFFWHHNVDRALGESMLGRREHPWWLYAPLGLYDMLPWSLALPAAGWYLWRSRAWRADPEARLGLAWFAAVLVVLSCVAFKRSDYLVPAYPGAALFLGCVAERWYLASAHRRRLACGFGLAAAAAAAGWWAYVEFALPRKDQALEYRRFAAEVRRHAPGPEPVLFFRTEAHALAFHVGRPLRVFVEWEKLDAWVGRSQPAWVVMPRKVCQECFDRLGPGRFDVVLTSTDLPGCKHDKPLVLLRSRPPHEPVHARAAAAAADRQPAAERSSARRQRPARLGRGGAGVGRVPGRPGPRA